MRTRREIGQLEEAQPADTQPPKPMVKTRTLEAKPGRKLRASEHDVRRPRLRERSTEVAKIILITRDTASTPNPE
jgi:hypothetical protein